MLNKIDKMIEQYKSLPNYYDDNVFNGYSIAFVLEQLRESAFLEIEEQEFEQLLVIFIQI